MILSELIQNFTTVLFPFRYDTEMAAAFNSPIVRKNGKEAQLWTPLDLHSYHLKSYISAMLGEGTAHGAIGQLYRLNDSLRRELELPEVRDKAEFFSRNQTEPAYLHLERVQLCLFTTGTGFLEFAFRTECKDAQQLLDVNYFLCEVKSSKNYLAFSQRLSKEECRVIRRPLLDMMRQLTGSLGSVSDFDAVEGLRYIDSKPLVFSYLLVDVFPEELGELLFHLRTNFKASYQVPQDARDLRTAKGIYHPFDNVYWGTSPNGTVCCAALTGDERTNEFFRTVFPANLRETYSLLFLLRQHQRFAMEIYRQHFHKIGVALTGEVSEEAEQAYAEIRSLQNRCSDFNVKCDYRDPTSVEHINEFDDFLYATLHLKEGMDSLEAGIQHLDSLGEQIFEKLKAQRQEYDRLRELKRDRAMYVITALWSCLLFMDEAWELAEHFLGRQIEIISPGFLMLLCIALVPAIPLVLELRRKSREIRILTKGAEKKLNNEK